MCKNVLFLMLAVCGFGQTVAVYAAETEPLDTTAFPVVLTPTRLKQAMQDVPASVTVIKADKLRFFNITSIPDALRLVPGMAVMEATGGDYRIGYHGTNILVPRRMNVLIDGVSVYQPAFARVEWDRLLTASET
jgi:iron complex outermembrane recepter protein